MIFLIFQTLVSSGPSIFQSLNTLIFDLLIVQTFFYLLIFQSFDLWSFNYSIFNHYTLWLSNNFILLVFQYFSFLIFQFLYLLSWSFFASTCDFLWAPRWVAPIRSRRFKWLPAMELWFLYLHRYLYSKVRFQPVESWDMSVLKNKICWVWGLRFVWLAIFRIDFCVTCEFVRFVTFVKFVKFVRSLRSLRLLKFEIEIREV
jgi:hypothetical protein